MNIDNLIPKEVKNISSYEVKTILERKKDKKIVKMDFNENLVTSNEYIQKILIEAIKNVDLRIYPSPRGSKAIETIYRFLDFDQSEISVANGADELLDLIMKTFVRRGKKVLTVEPTFPMYTFFTELYGGTKNSAYLDSNFSLNVDKILNKVDKATSLIFLCSPNNPTGNQFLKEDIEILLKEFDGILVVDEAYADFAPYSTMNLVKEYNNLIVLRSFSKAFGLAGLRLGYLVSNKVIVDYIQKVTSPFNLNSLTQEIITIALRNWDYFKKQINVIIEERNWLVQQLKNIDGITTYPSDANFVLFRVTEQNLTSQVVQKRLEKERVMVKDRGFLPLLQNCIRVTVGTRKMNKSFLFELRKILEA
jgi:histidinol-phosphate aminotransferase